MAFARADLLLTARADIDDGRFADAMMAEVASAPVEASIAVRLARLASLATSAVVGTLGRMTDEDARA